MGVQSFSGSATLADGAATITQSCSGRILNAFTLTTNFAVSVPATSLEIDKDSIDLLTNKTETITATLSEGSTDTVTWTSSDENVATVDSKGVVTGVGDGTATITASVRELSKTCAVTVTTVHPTSLAIESENIVDGVLRIRKTDSATATAVIEPAEISDEVVWSIEEAGGATVSQDGVITSKDYGTGTLTVTAGELTASVPVEVYRVPAESVTFRETEVTPLFYDVITLYIDVLPENTTDTVTWSMENSDLGNFNGRYADHAGYYAFGVGTNVITATVGDVSDTCTVTVNDIIEPEDGLPAPIDCPSYDDVVMDRCGVSTTAEVTEIKWDEETPDLLHVVLAAGTEDGTRVKGMGRAFIQSYSASGWSSWYRTEATLENGAANFTVSVYNRGMGFEKVVTFDIAVEESTEPVTATVDITSQMSGGYLHAPAFGETVSSDLAESYGYTDEVADGVSALDVLVRAHELTFGEDFTAETAADYLVIESGNVKKQFGVDPVEGYMADTFLGSFTVNDMYPSSDETVGGQYMGLVVAQAKVVDGDKVDFLFGENEYMGDMTNWFLNEDEEYIGDEFTVAAGEDLTLYLRGTYLYLLLDCKTFPEIVAKYSDNETMMENCEGIQLYTVDLATGALTEIEDAVTDLDGEVTLSFDEPGTYTIVAYGVDEEYEMFNHVMRMSTVTVTEAQPAGPAAQIVSASLTLAGDIGVNFFVIPNDELLADEGAYAQLTAKGVTGDKIMLADLTPDNDGRFTFTQFVAAKEMTEQITLAIYTADGTAVALTDANGSASDGVYSVARFVRTAAEVGSEKLQALAAKLASYGAYAKAYFEYEPMAEDTEYMDAIAGDITGDITVETVTPYKPVKDPSTDAFKAKSISLVLKSETILKVTFAGTD
ncbi:MAG: Ig-like domain-containing protein, partial [Oscillospiraceae bacterium]|nr:Ig-like domain-containing protein [Oscillospiraceae bacterium]